MAPTVSDKSQVKDGLPNAVIQSKLQNVATQSKLQNAVTQSGPYYTKGDNLRLSTDIKSDVKRQTEAIAARQTEESNGSGNGLPGVTEITKTSTVETENIVTDKITHSPKPFRFPGNCTKFTFFQIIISIIYNVIQNFIM